VRFRVVGSALRLGAAVKDKVLAARGRAGGDCRGVVGRSALRRRISQTVSEGVSTVETGVQACKRKCVPVHPRGDTAA
jgi:hypothetical protein